MDLNSLLLTLTPIIGIGALGVYVVLTSGNDAPGSLERRTGAGMAGLSLVTLGLFVGGRCDWWPQSVLQSGVYSTLFILLACASIVSAASTITCRASASSIVWFAAMLLSNAGLYVFLGTHILGLVTISAFAGAAFIAHSFRSRRTGPQFEETTDHADHEPLLACASGALLAIALVGTLHFAVATEAGRTVAAEKKQHTGSLRRSAMPKQSPKQAAVVPDYHLLNNSLVVGAMLFVLGTVGFLSRRNRIVMVLAAGTSLQGVLLTLAAFGMFHGNWSGRILALFAMAVAAVEGGLAAVLMKTSGREARP